MSSVQPQLDHRMDYWNIPRVITYPTPPYITLRINLGLHQDPPFPRPRLLLDMIRKFSSAKDGRYYRPDEEEEEEDVRLAGGEVYKKRTSQTSQIHDERNKWIFYNPSSGLTASPKQNSEGAKFEITSYIQRSNTDKVPITLKINGTNLYLSCSNGELILEDPNNSGETLETIEGSTRRFLFLRTRSVKSVTFESVMSPGMFICTDYISRPSPVNISNFSDNQKIVSFTIDGEVGGSFVMVENNRFFLQIPMEILERLQENNQLMENTYERFTYIPYGILIVW